ncbi:MAG: MFS transporter [Chloroflexi bacterium]|nr:MFS transporter [Chloroflexota bacterium]
MSALKEEARARVSGGRFRVYYGWYVAAAATGGMYVSATLANHTLPIFLKPMATELGWTRTNFFLASTIASVVAGLLAPLAGRIVDRGNVRLMVLAGGLIAATSVITYSRLHSLWAFWILAGILTPLGLSLCGSAVFSAVVVKWFIRRRGRAMSLLGVGTNLSGITTAPLATFLIAAMTWRTAWVVYGVGVLAWAVLASLVIRRSPEEAGLRADAPASVSQPGAAVLTQGEQAWTWRQVLGTPTFWLVLLSVGITMLASSGVSPHTYPLLTDKGVPTTIAASMISLVSLVGLSLRAVWAYIYERWDPRYAAVLLFLSFALSTAGLVLTDRVVLLYLSLAVRGIAAGGMTAIMPMLYSHYFGRRSVGQIIGLFQLLSLPFGASGSLLSAVAFDATGSYTIVFSFFIACFAVAGLAVLRVHRPVPRAERAAPAQQ